MVCELEELVGLLASTKQEIRQAALENLIGYTIGLQASIFKVRNLKPVKDLKILVRDTINVSENALTALINLSDDAAIEDCLVVDKPFLELLLFKLFHLEDTSADLAAMLLANMSRNMHFAGNILNMIRTDTQFAHSSSEMVINQILDLFIQGADGAFNKHANFDYLAYLFANIAMNPKGRSYLVKEQSYDNVVPLSKVIVFTEHHSLIRRIGVASTIKNTLLDTISHEDLVSQSSVNLFPYLLLPLMSYEQYPEDETTSMPPQLRLLDPSKAREVDKSIMITHLESLLMLTTTKDARARMREISVYAVIRELHLAASDEQIRECCERVVNVLKREDATDEADKNSPPQIAERHKFEDEIADII